MIRIAVGERHPVIPAGQPEGVRFAVSPDGLELMGIVSRVGPRDERAWRRGRTRLGLVPGGDHTLFLLYEIEGFGPWSDAPFSAGLAPAARRGAPAREPGQGYLLSMTLIEHETMIVRALRAVSVSAAFADALDGLVRSQAGHFDAFTPAAQNRDIAAAYARWPDSRDMVRAAVIVETAGRIDGDGA